MEIQADLSVCTVVFKNAKALKGLLTSLHETSSPVSLEVIVVDATGAVDDLFSQEFPELILYEDLHETDHVKALNRGLELATGRYVSIWDNDVLVLEKSLHSLLDFLDTTPDVGIAGPNILDAYKKTEPSPQKFPALTSIVPGLFPFNTSKKIPPPSGIQENIEIEWLQSGCHVIRREVFEEIGFFDSSLPWTFAQMDYYHRSKKAGWHNFLCTEATVFHPNPARYHPELRPTCSFTDVAKNYFRYFSKHWFPKKTYFQKP